MLIHDQFVVKSRFLDYEVLFIDDFAIPIKQNAANDTLFIIDHKIYSLYKSRLDPILTEEKVILIDALETNKNIDYCQIVIKRLIEKNIRRNYTIIAIGGGIIQDISSFIASILYRGVEWIFLPTTLLAQADSCIGSKTSINMGEYKNLLGNFYPPSRVFIDVGFLETLPSNAIKSGIGEILHFYLNAGHELTKKLIDNYDALLSSPKGLKEYIKASLMIKKKVIEIDEFDKNERNLFNYGHTFGHAIETVSEYRISHGQAVTMGMDIANYISLKLGLINEGIFESMHEILLKNMPSFMIKEDMIDHYLKALSRDKKNIGNNLVCILTNGPGSMKKEHIPIDNKLREIIYSYFNK